MTQALGGEPWRCWRSRAPGPGDHRLRVSRLGSGGGARRPADPGCLTAAEGEPLEHARSFLGAPYRWGGLTSRRDRLFRPRPHQLPRLGRLVPRDAADQEAAGEAPARRESRAGSSSLLLRRPADHVGFWLGGGPDPSRHRPGGARSATRTEPDELRSAAPGSGGSDHSFEV